MAKKKTEEKKPKLEREYIIPLREKCRPVPRYKKTPKAIKTIKEFLARHMKIRDRDLKKIKLDSYLNNAVWMRGIKNPPHKIKVKAIKEGDIVRVELAEMPKKLLAKKAREEKREAAAEQTKKKKVVEKPKEKPEEDGEKKEEKEKKAEELEKKASVVEAGAKMEKAAAKQMKHQVGGKTKEPKRPKRQAMAK
jgi:large subunit ribosomal protein L31e